MTGISITCPHCAKVLRPKTAPPAGRKVKCPSCETAFLPELDDSEVAAGIQTETKIKTKANTNGKQTKLATTAEPPGNRRPQPRKRKEKPANNMMLYVILGGAAAFGFLMLLVVGGVTAFVWPGFLRSKEAQAATVKTQDKTQETEKKAEQPKGKAGEPAKQLPPPAPVATPLTAFVTPDANLLVGFKAKVLRDQFVPLDQMFRKRGGGPQGNGDEMEVLLLKSEMALIFGNAGGFNSKLAVVLKVAPADLNNFKNGPLLGPPQTIGGHANVYQPSNVGIGKGLRGYVAFPSDDIILFCEQDQQQLIAALNAGKKPAPNALVDLSRSVEQSHGYLALLLDGKMRGEMRKAFEDGAKLAPTLRTAAAGIDNATGLTLSVDANPGQNLKIAAKLMCQNPADSEKVKLGVEDAYRTFKGLIQLAAMAGPQGGKGPPIPPTLMRDLDSVRFETQGAVASATIDVSVQTLQGLAELGKKQPVVVVQNPPPFNPPPFNPPPINPPPLGGKVQTFTLRNIPANQAQERGLFLPQGKRVIITATGRVSKLGTDVDLYVYRGAVGQNLVAADASIGPNSRVEFIVPANDTYRIRISNLGPGLTTSCVVTIREQ